MNANQDTLIQVTSEGMGQGSAELGIKLVSNYFKLLVEENRLPKIIAFYNAGVKLLTQDHPALEIFKNVEQQGTMLLACKTCLNHFELLDKLAVGTCGTMIDIIELQSKANKVITL